MAINYADDEQINDIEASSGVHFKISKADDIRVTTINRKEAPLKETELNVLLKNAGAEMGKDRLGVDIVIVLDVTNNDDNLKYLNEMKAAMQLLIQNLRHYDRLSIVTHARASTKRQSPLLRMKDDSKAKIEKVVNDLQLVNGSGKLDQITNDDVRTVGLKTALKVLNDRVLKARRVSAIMLVMCNPVPQINIAGIKFNVPVYTFGLSPNHDQKVLKEIATASMGKTFLIADDQKKTLSAAFSECLAGLLTVVVEDLKLTIRKTVNSNNKEVSLGKNLKPEDKDVDYSKLVLFGDLNAADSGAVMIDLLELTYSYTIGDFSFQEAKPLALMRAKTPMDKAMEAMKIDEVGLRTVGAIEKAIQLANKGKFDEAQDVIVKAQNKLEDEFDERKESLDKLKVRMYELIQFMQSKETYKSFRHTKGHALRDDVVNSKNPPKFTTPLMDKCLKQLTEYNNSNSKLELPTIIKDLNQVLTESSGVAATSGGVRYHIEEVINTLKKMQQKVDAAYP